MWPASRTSVPGAVDLEADFVYVHDGWLHALVGAETPFIYDRVALRGGDRHR